MQAGVALGSSVNAGTLLVQVPTEFAHDLQVAVQAFSQQVLSTQKPDEHSVPRAQPWPLRLRQLPLPSQVEVPVHTGLELRSSTYLPRVTEQLPLALAHDRHCVVQALSQQVLSTQ